jgi:beta-glucosidase/6-phospho-beta-glucosidase/beta-galactosidase
MAEWSDGYGVRFGVTYTDYETLERTPKRSALHLKESFGKRMRSTKMVRKLSEEHVLNSVREIASL